MEMPFFSKQEERLHTISHGFGLVLSLLGTGLLIVHAFQFNNSLTLFSFVVFGLSLVFCFLTSTIYHHVEDLPLKQKLRILDHFAIYGLIAGTYTPFALNNLPWHWGYLLFGLIWFFSLSGMLFKFLIRHKLQSYEKIDAALYAGLGLSALLFINLIITYISLGGVLLLVAGGALYLTGIYFYLNGRVKFNHFIWHIFVLLGAACHFTAVFYYAIPLQQS